MKEIGAAEVPGEQHRHHERDHVDGDGGQYREERGEPEGIGNDSDFFFIPREYLHKVVQSDPFHIVDGVEFEERHIDAHAERNDKSDQEGEEGRQQKQAEIQGIFFHYFFHKKPLSV
jgi:hypothetical protein